MADDPKRSLSEVFKQFVQSSKLAQSIQMQAQQTMSAVSSHVREVIPQTIQEISDFAKKTLSNVANFFKGVWEDVGKFFGVLGPEEKQEKKAQEEREKQTSWLRKIYDYFQASEKAKLRDFDKKGPPKSFKDILALGIVGMLGAVIGAFIRTIILPIELLLKLPGIRRIKGIFKPFKGLLVRMLSWLDDIPFIGRLLRGVSAGFKILGWPLTLLLGVIDFVKGFMDTEGDIFDKIKGGFTVAIMKFLELPIRALGWILEKLGIEDATAKIAAIFKSTIGFIFDLVYSIFSGIYDAVKIFPWDIVKNAIDKIGNFFSSLFGGIWSKIKESKIFKWVASKFGGIDIEKGDPFATETITKGVKAQSLEAPKVESIENVTDDLYKARKKMSEMSMEDMKKLIAESEKSNSQMKDLKKALEEQKASVVSIAQKGAREPEPPKEPPSNQESLGMALTNMVF